MSRRRGARAEVVVVTGASAGVGRAVVREFALEGACIGLIARGAERLEQTCREVEGLGGRALALPLDVASAQDVEAAAARVEAEFGPLDVWINNAMVTVFSPFLELRPEEFRRVLEVDVLGYVHGTQAALRRMLPRDHGSIVQVGSALAYRAIPLQSAYCAAKHAVRGFSESVRTELLHQGSRVHLAEVHLPAVNTPQFDWSKSRMPHRARPVPPIYQPELAARAIRWAARRRRRELHVGLSAALAIQVDKLAPGLADRYLACTAYAAQQSAEPEDPGRPHNLWRSVPRDVGAHGRFGACAARHSAQLWWTTHRRVLASLGLGALVAGALAARRGA